ncbi:hypothetical protein GIB67_040873 [Kingdonia uniflora]|uniref:RING-type E3 ubiquitin transferase n=1 Tax=Kingdonia uniflora TaxID=39325 RepID=A0A7J7L7Y7_9MAGN|nr:hypothetical protein GIB67_040873 [Kingdonia uniflora]
MAPGSSVCKEIVPESQSVDMDLSSTNDILESFHLSKTSNVSSVKGGISSTNGVHELLECPICTKSMYPPIHQCPNGHTLCSNCKLRVHNHCPTCRCELGNIRCLALEKVAESLELPCGHLNLGCPEVFPYYSKLKHEQLCRFRPYNCPYAGSECSTTGDIPMLVAHLKNDHKVDMHEGCTFNHRYVKANPQEVENATWMLTHVKEKENTVADGLSRRNEVLVTLRASVFGFETLLPVLTSAGEFAISNQRIHESIRTHLAETYASYKAQVFNCFGQSFCLHFEAFLLGISPVYMAFLRFMGDDNEAKNFSYSLEVGGNGRKLTWQGVPRSIRDSHKKVRDSYDGLVIHRNIALFFSGGNRQELKLRVTGRIWREQ